MPIIFSFIVFEEMGMESENKREKLKEFALEFLKKIKLYGRPVFLCVGSDKYVCDSLAPMVAERLKKTYNVNAYVYGGLDYNIDGTNLMEAVNYIETEHPNSFLVLIDATLGDDVGEVKITEGSFAGLGRTLPIRKIGTLSILGVVARKGKDFSLNSTRLKVVVELAEFISTGCAMALDFLDASFVPNSRICCNTH